MDLEKIFNVGYQGFVDGSVHFFSPRIAELTGYDMEEFNSKAVNWVNDVIHPEDELEARQALIKGLKTDKIYTRAYRILTKSGEEKWILELSQIMCNDEGKLDYVSGTLIDITAEKEEELARARIAGLSGKYLFFSLKGQEYGIDILNIREIIGLMPITPLPDTPGFIKGVINLRGRVIPVMDLRLRLDLGAGETDERTCIIVAETNDSQGAVLAGMIVDAVSEVLFIEGTEVEDSLDDFIKVEGKYVQGLAKTSQGLKTLLNIEYVIPAQELTNLPPAP